MVLNAVTGFITGIIADPVYLTLTGGMTVYMIVAFGRRGAVRKLEALRGKFTLNVVILLITGVLAKWFMYVSGEPYFLIGTLVDFILALTIFDRLKILFPR